MPSGYAGRIQTLIARRAEHPGPPLVGHLNGWIEDAVGLRRGGNRVDIRTLRYSSARVRRSTAQLRVEPGGLSREVVAFGDVGR